MQPIHHTLDVTQSHPFSVPEECDWLVLNVDTGSSATTWAYYLIWDPKGRLRYQHLDVNSSRTIAIHVDPARTSLNAVPGEIPAGSWRIDFNFKGRSAKLHYISGNGPMPMGGFRPNVPGPLRAFWANAAGTERGLRLDQYDWDRPFEQGSRWYKGDTHLHSLQSDGSLSVDHLTKSAKSLGFDFIVITDHNILPTSWPMGDLLVIPGMEYTVKMGHWVATGLRALFDWHPLCEDGGISTDEGMNRLLREAGACGALRTLAHPFYPGESYNFRDTNLDQVDGIEILRSPADPKNDSCEPTLAAWTLLWNDGRQITGMGGSDFHHSEIYVAGGQMARLGFPTTCVWAGRLSANAITEGMRQKRVYVTAGPVLEWDVMVDGRSYPLGSDLSEAIGKSRKKKVDFRVRVEGLPEGMVCWIEDGIEVARSGIRDGESLQRVFAWGGDRYRWVRADIRACDGRLLAFGNPVYSGKKTPTIRTWGELLSRGGW